MAVSVKHILDSTGRRSVGDYAADANIVAAITDANKILTASGARWRLVLLEILDVPGISEYFEISSSAEMRELEDLAKTDNARYAWRNDAINVYIPQVAKGAYGICSFPHADNIILIANLYSDSKLPTGGVLWLHEIGHYFSLTHTFQGSNSLACTGMAAFHRNFAVAVSCDDTCPDDFNVMSYNSPTVESARLTECQLRETNFELFDTGGSRAKVLLGEHVIQPEPEPEPRFKGSFVRGDVVPDRVTNISDPVSILFFLFHGRRGIVTCLSAADTNDDGTVDLADAVYMLNFLFRGGPELPPPVGACGTDATKDQLGCAKYEPCNPVTGSG